MPYYAAAGQLPEEMDDEFAPNDPKLYLTS